LSNIDLLLLLFIVDDIVLVVTVDLIEFADELVEDLGEEATLPSLFPTPACP
jgi:hypothetical protein